MRESIAAVLAEQSSSTAVHAFIDGKNSLAGTVVPGRIPRLARFRHSEQYGGLGLGCHGLAILHNELGRQAAPGPYIATLSAAQAIVESGTEAIRARGCRASRPVKSAPPSRPRRARPS